MALYVPEMCFWPVKARKNLELFEMHTFHWTGAQIWFRHKWRKLDTTSLLLHRIDGYSCHRYWNEFFLSCVSGFRLKFSRVALWWKRLQLDSRSDLATNDSNLGFLFKNCFFRCIHISMEWNLQELLNYCSFLTTSNFFDV